MHGATIKMRSLFCTYLNTALPSLVLKAYFANYRRGNQLSRWVRQVEMPHLKSFETLSILVHVTYYREKIKGTYMHIR